MSKHLRWDSHKNHWELLKEFYYLNKYLITEQLKDALLDAMECMEYTMNEKGESYKEEGKKYHMPKADIQPVDRWISVKDRLPDGRECVIVYTVEGSVLEMKFDKRRESWGRLDIDGMKWFGKSFVTHWQPLLEPPKKGDTND